MNPEESSGLPSTDLWASRSANPGRSWLGAPSDRSDSGADRTDDITAIISIAWNIRRIFVVALTFLVIFTIYLMATLYVTVADEPSKDLFTGVILLSVLVGAVGVWYAIDSKRLSK